MTALLTLTALSLAALAGYLCGHKLGRKKGHAEGVAYVLWAIAESKRQAQAAVASALSPKTPEQAHKLADAIERGRDKGAWN